MTLRPLLLLPFLLLQGCALAPGMRVLLPGDAEPLHANAPEVPLKVRLAELTPGVLAELARQDDQPVTLSPALSLDAPAYVITPGDVLNVSIYDHPEFSMTAQGVTGANASIIGYVVDAQGAIQFPLVGQVTVKGLTPSQVSQKLAAGLVKYVQAPNVTVRVIQYRGNKVLVDGLVRNPGLVPLTDAERTLPEVLGVAGGLLPNADQTRVLLFRDGQQHELHLPRLMRSGVAAHRIALKDGDVVRVPSQQESQVYVIGEVPKPVAVPLRFDGLRLSEALGEALGVSALTGHAGRVYVVRNHTLGEAEVYHLDATSPLALALADNFRLRARDVVYVDSTTLVRLNRVINLVLPGSTAARNGQLLLQSAN